MGSIQWYWCSIGIRSYWSICSNNNEEQRRTTWSTISCTRYVRYLQICHRLQSCGLYTFTISNTGSFDSGDHLKSSVEFDHSRYLFILYFILNTNVLLPPLIHIISHHFQWCLVHFFLVLSFSIIVMIHPRRKRTKEIKWRAKDFLLYSFLFKWILISYSSSSSSSLLLLLLLLCYSSTGVWFSFADFGFFFFW